MEYAIVLARLRQTFDALAFARRIGIALRREHDTERNARVPLRFGAIQRAVDRMIDELCKLPGIGRRSAERNTSRVSSE